MSEPPDPDSPLRDLWDDAHAASLDPVERLVYRSNLLGADQRVTNTGGGNTSSKLAMPDPLSGDPVEVLWVKGSGGDLRTAGRENFASLTLEGLERLRALYDRAEPKGVKTPIEDAMVAMYPHTVYDLNPRASSIDTPLHAFIPYRHVDHTHPNAAIAIAAAADAEALTREIYGHEVGWVPWQRPGFDLGLTMGRIARDNPNLRGLIMGQHGLINWDDDDRACYRLSLDLIRRAADYLDRHDRGNATFGGRRYAGLDEADRERVLIEILPRLRGMVSQQRRLIGTVETRDAILRFVDSHDAPRLAELGTSCPDHFLRTKIKPLYIAWDPATEDVEALLAKLAAGLEAYREDYATYYAACKRPDSPPMRDPNPTVILIPGVGMIAWGKSKSESRVTAEFYCAAVEVMRGAEAVSRYAALPQQEAFDIEYWALEEAKLQRMPPEREFARKVAVVIGAGGGVGRAAAVRLAAEGAHVVCADLDGEAAERSAGELIARHGIGIGVAGSGISGCGPAIGLRVDVGDRASVHALFDRVLLAYGGIDTVVVAGGIVVTPDREEHPTDERGAHTVAVTGSYLIADEAARIWRAQGLSGSLVLTTGVEGAVAEGGSLAYDTGRAAANHLVRELAMELAPLVRVNGLAPAVEGDRTLPHDRVLPSLADEGDPFDEAGGALRDRLAAALADQAEAAILLAGERLALTSGHILSVDGGLHDDLLG
jgi:rhamnulose-1-phosphate aldolase/alcohol dehydrogenase